MNLSSVDDTHKETWFMQAEACIKLLSFWNKDDNYNEHMRKQQDAYLIFGVVVWGIMLEPNWGLDDMRCSLWYKMGLAAVPSKHGSNLLLSQY